MSRAGIEPFARDQSEPFARLLQRWTALTVSARAIPDAWPIRLAAMRRETEALSRRGLWVEGPHDLLSIIGLARWELAHSAALAWLCNPYASHGLGAGFLEAIIAETGEPLDLHHPIETSTEVARREARADVIVTGGGWTLVIEVKVDAVEQPNQAQRLFEDWRNDGDVRFIFLTRHTRPPATALPQTRDVWTPISWRRVRKILRMLVTDSPPSGRAAPAVHEYLATLESTF